MVLFMVISLILKETTAPQPVTINLFVQTISRILPQYVIKCRFRNASKYLCSLHLADLECLFPSNDGQMNPIINFVVFTVCLL